MGRGSARSTALGENTAFYSNERYTAQAVFAFSQVFCARSLTWLTTWLITPNTVLLKRFVRNKSEPLCDEVELLDANPKTALVRFPDGRESTVSVSDLAPLSDMSDNEPCDVPEKPTENRTLTLKQCSQRPGRMDMPGMTLPRQIKSARSTCANSSEFD